MDVLEQRRARRQSLTLCFAIGQFTGGGGKDVFRNHWAPFALFSRREWDEPTRCPHFQRLAMGGCLLPVTPAAAIASLRPRGRSRRTERESRWSLWSVWFVYFIWLSSFFGYSISQPNERDKPNKQVRPSSSLPTAPGIPTAPAVPRIPMAAACGLEDANPAAEPLLWI